MKMKANNKPSKSISGRDSRDYRVGPGLHTNGYRPNGPNTSEGCNPPNVGTGVNKKCK